MKRLLAVLLLLCTLPHTEPAPVQRAAYATDRIAFETADTPEQDPDPLWEADPNWVPAEEPSEAAEAFAADGLVPRHCGMRPLSRYAQEYEPTEEDLILAARVAYLEAGGKEEAYRAVLCVLYNRCVAPRFGGGITDISTEVYRKHQFSVIHHKRFSTLEPPEEIVEAARDIFVSGNLDLPEDVLFFKSAKLGKQFGGRKFYKNIGGNLFYYGSVD